MRNIHRATISVFVKPENDLEKVKEGLVALIPFDLQEEKVKLQKQSAEGFNDKTIKILTIELTKISHTNDFLQFLLDNLKEEQKELLIEQKESRLDAEYDFFIRIDKDRWMENKEIWLTDRGTCYHIKLSLAVYPKNKDTAGKLVDKIFSQKNI